MSMESIFRIAFWLIFGGMLALQAVYALRLRLAGQSTASDRKAVKREGWLIPAIRVLRSMLLLAFLVLYAMDPPWFGVLSLPLPDGLRWLGFALGVLSLALYAWARNTLGKEWSSCLRMGQQHRLVTTGPYAWVRHPIYLAMIGFETSLALVTANWLLVAFLIISIVDLAIRIPREEQMMIEAFGDAYEDYMQTTRRIFPKSPSATLRGRDTERDAPDDGIQGFQD